MHMMQKFAYMIVYLQLKIISKKKKFTDFVNDSSLKIIKAKIEQSLVNANPGDRFQFERVGYFCADLDHNSNNAIFNRTLSLQLQKKYKEIKF